MRTDITIDGRQVRCPHASTLGYGKWKAQLGDWVSWTQPTDGDHGVNNIGRMIGRVAYDPQGECTGWIVVLSLGMEMTTVFERWVRPEWVFQVHANTPDIARFLAWYAGQLPDVDYLRRMCEYGAGKANQNPDWPDWDHARGLERFGEYLARVRESASVRP